MGSSKKQISQKNLYVIIIAFIILAIFATLMPYYSIKVMNGLRGYLTAESRWSKAQKTAIHELIRYGTYQEEEYWENFNDNLEILQGSKDARIALLAENPDYEVASDRFQQGGVNPEFIDDMNWLFRRFRNFEIFNEALEHWEEGDEYVEKLHNISGEIHNEIENGTLDQASRNAYLDELYEIDARLHHLVNEFVIIVEDAISSSRDYILVSNILLGILMIGLACIVTVILFRKANNLNDRLSETKEKFSHVLDNSRDIIYQMDAEGKNFEYVSPVVETMLGYKVEELMEKGPEFILEKVHPDDLKRIQDARKQTAYRIPQQEMELDTEYRLQTTNGHYIWVNNRRSVVTDENGNYHGVVGNVRDITERKTHLEQLDESLKEKDTLLAEIHHRVKNNLAIISSLIEMHKKEHDEKIQVTLKDLQARIKTIALVHEKLYQNDSFGEVELSEYVNGLVDLVSKSMISIDKQITIERDLDDIRFNLTNAVPFGLICNELISNAYKHAFKNRRDGIIRLELKKEGNLGVFSIKDNGVGLPDEFSISNEGSLGMVLVDNLAKQLKGQLTIHSNGWTEFKVSFEVDD